MGLRDASYRGIYDLCIEALSDLDPADIRGDTVTKKAAYAAAGVPEYYILHHNPKPDRHEPLRWQAGSRVEATRGQGSRALQTAC